MSGAIVNARSHVLLHKNENHRLFASSLLRTRNAVGINNLNPAEVAMHRVDDGSMKFLVSRQRNVREILALSVSPNKRVIAVCEKGRSPDEDPGSAQVRDRHDCCRGPLWNGCSVTKLSGFYKIKLLSSRSILHMSLSS